MNMSLIHCTSLSHVSGKKVGPNASERFSRQLVPDRASCSLSGGRGREGGGREGWKERGGGRGEGERWKERGMEGEGGRGEMEGEREGGSEGEGGVASDWKL